MPIGDEVLSSFTQKVRQERTYAERKLKVGIIGTAGLPRPMRKATCASRTWKLSRWPT